MNFALPTILVFLLVLPGFLFRSRLKLAEQTSLDYSPFGRVVAEALLWTVALHVVWLSLAYLQGWVVRTEALLGLLSSSATLQDTAVHQLAQSSGRVAVYFTTLYAFAFVVPWALRTAISHWRLDRQGARFSSILRFYQAPWYYLLTGADFPPGDEPDYISIAAVVDVAGSPILYVGILADFFFESDGKLDRLVLENVARRPMTRDKTDLDDDRFYNVEGDYFVIRYAEVITLNVKYVKFEPVDVVLARAPVDDPLLS